ncbi:MAG TPA: LuxR C-terminal-related transcriptional regulator [Fimbriimonadaceae bacterium]|nr:LuxR C-terminal-related transcriptional regulator [Fimbriimonadaceae bacterium]
MHVGLVIQDRLFGESVASLLTYVGGIRVDVSADSIDSILSTAAGQNLDAIVIDEPSLKRTPRDRLTSLKGKVRLVGIETHEMSGEAPVDAIVARNAGGESLFRAVRGGAAAAGRARSVHEPLVPYGSTPTLSPREREVAQLVAKGLPNRRIASILGLREQSVKNLVSTIMRKLRCENRVQIALRLSQPDMN